MTDLNLTSYDPSELKEDLIAFMQSKPEFADFNYEGSTLNTLIDLLVRNGHYIAYMASMVANESFLQTAQLRKNVVAHAQKLSYFPKSKTAPTCIVDVNVTPPLTYTNNAPFIVASKGRVFVSSVEGNSYYFTNPRQFTLYRFPDGTYRSTDVELKQGTLVKDTYTYNQQAGFFDIDNPSIDTSTLRLYVRNQAGSEAIEYTMITEIVDAGKTDRNFFLSETTEGRYKVEFGKDILGLEPPNNAVIEVEYISTENELADGTSELDAVTAIGQFSNIETTVTTPAFGGAEAESIDRIKFLAPRVYQTNGRAVKESDFIPLIQKEFPFIRTANAWGGEKNDPPYFGRVMISAVPEQGVTILDYLKREIVTKMNQYAVGSITTMFVDPTYFGVDLTAHVKLDRNKTSLRPSDITPIVQEQIESYTDTNLKYFGSYYNNSLALSYLSEYSFIDSVEINKVVFTEQENQLGVNYNYTASFSNELKPSSFKLTNFITDTSLDDENIYDDGEGNIVHERIVGTTRLKKNVGTIDYDTGKVSLTIVFVGGDDLIKMEVKSVSDNFYTNQDQVLFLNSIIVEYV